MSMTLAEIHRKGWDALVRELGYSGAIKFILFYENGEGDYVKEREEIFRDMTGREIFQEIKRIKEDFHLEK
jgi:hypothetical protein